MEIVDAGVDWLTLTRPHADDLNPAWADELKAIIRSDWFGGQSGVDLNPWAWNGYSGEQFGPLSIGVRPDSVIVRCSGYASRYLLRGYWDMHWKCTRIDLQATVREGRDCDARIRVELGKVLGARSGKEGRPVGVRHIQGYGAGDSLYVGSRSSPKFYRIYNKEAESGFATEYAGAVRYELEAKNGTAERTFWWLNDNRRHENGVLHLLDAALRDIGVDTLEGANYVPSEFWRVVPRETDAERQLAWLEKSVGPVVRKLAGQGLMLDVMQALGIRYEAEAV